MSMLDVIANKSEKKIAKTSDLSNPQGKISTKQNGLYQGHTLTIIVYDQKANICFGKFIQQSIQTVNSTLITTTLPQVSIFSSFGSFQVYNNLNVYIFYGNLSVPRQPLDQLYYKRCILF